MTMGQYACLRQFTGLLGHCIKWLPFPPSEDGEDHQIVIMGCLQNQVLPPTDSTPGCRDIQECMLLADLAMAGGRGAPLRASLQPLATFEHAGGRMTALAVAQPGNAKNTGAVVLFSGSAGGQLSCVPVDLPRHAGAQVEEIHVRGGIIETDDGAHATDGAPLHAGAVQAIDVCDQSDQVATAGLDGQLLVFDATSLSERGAAASPTVLAAADHRRSFYDVRWTMPNSIVGASTAGGLQMWDARAAGRPVAESPREWGFLANHQGRLGCAVTCIAAHPARPHVCAVGTSDSAVAIWDLRFLRKPTLSAVAPEGAGRGAVNALCFDRFRSRDAELPLLACTDGGQLLELSAAGPGAGASVRVVAEEYGAIVALDVDAGEGGRVVACTDLESLVVVDRRSA